MSFVRVQHIYNALSGLNEDGIVNVFHFLGPPPTQTNMAALAQAVIDFYDVNNTSGDAIHGYIHSASLATNRHTVKVYDMNGARPSPPIFETTPIAPTPGNTGENIGFPHEVAVCLSYRTTPAPGQIPARHRGRIFIGPLTTAAKYESGAPHVVRPAPTLRTCLLEAGARFKADAQADGWSWVGFSPTTAGPARPVVGEAGVFFINQLMVDDAFDTQRRRGEDRTLVQTVTL